MHAGRAPGLLGVLLQAGVLILAVWTGSEVGRRQRSTLLGLQAASPSSSSSRGYSPGWASARRLNLVRWLPVLTVLTSTAGLIGAVWLAVQMLF